MRKRFATWWILFPILAVLLGTVSIIHSLSLQGQVDYLMKEIHETKRKIGNEQPSTNGNDPYKQISDELIRLEKDLMRIESELKP